MTVLTWVAVSLAVVVIALLVLVTVRRRREDELWARFGSEGERAADLTGSRNEAEDRLTVPPPHRGELTIDELDPVSRARFDEDWLIVQSRFVDDPGPAVVEADALVIAVMRVRGYPVEVFEERAWTLAADHADVVEHFRLARAAHTRHLQSGRSGDEDLRQAFRHYRMLYAVLSGTPEDRSSGSDTSTGTVTGSEPVACPESVTGPELVADRDCQELRDTSKSPRPRRSREAPEPRDRGTTPPSGSPERPSSRSRP